MSGQSRRKQAELRRTAAALIAEGNDADGRYHRGRDIIAHNAALLGLDDDGIAAILTVDRSTFDRFMVERSTFRRAVQKGRGEADGQVARALHSVAVGYKHKETKLFNAPGGVQAFDIVKHYPPNVAAITLWLANRQKDKWKDSKAVDHASTVDLMGILQALTRPAQSPGLPGPTQGVDDRSDQRPTLDAVFIDATGKEP